MGTLLEEKHYMAIAALGKFSISVTPMADNPLIYSVDIGSENRKDAVSMQTNVGETPDQFGMRVKSMLRALLNGEVKEKSDVKSSDSSGKKRVVANQEGNKDVQVSGH